MLLSFRVIQPQVRASHGHLFAIRYLSDQNSNVCHFCMKYTEAACRLNGTLDSFFCSHPHYGGEPIFNCHET